MYAKHVAYKGSCCCAKLQHNCSSWNFNEDKSLLQQCDPVILVTMVSSPLCTLSWRTDEVHPNQQTVLHFQESAQDQVVQAEAFMDHRGYFSLGAAGAQFWIILNTTKHGEMIIAEGCCSRLRWCPPGAECSSTPSGELNGSVEATNYFFWFKLSQVRGCWSPQGAWRGGDGMQEHSAQGSQLR